MRKGHRVSDWSDSQLKKLRKEFTVMSAAGNRAAATVLKTIEEEQVLRLKLGAERFPNRKKCRPLNQPEQGRVLMLDGNVSVIELPLAAIRTGKAVEKIRALRDKFDEQIRARTNNRCIGWWSFLPSDSREDIVLLWVRRVVYKSGKRVGSGKMQKHVCLLYCGRPDYVAEGEISSGKLADIVVKNLKW